MLAAQDASTLRGLRDCAILATLLYHGLRRAKLYALHLVDLQERCGVHSLRVHGTQWPGQLLATKGASQIVKPSPRKTVSARQLRV